MTLGAQSESADSTARVAPGIARAPSPDSMELTTRGLKAYDRTIALVPLTCILGPNGAGKSTLANAIRIAALGYEPALGKRPQDTAALLRGDAYELRFTPLPDRTITRTLRRVGKSLTATVHCSWLDEGASPADHAAAVLALFGAEEVDVAEGLDIRGLLHATPNQRAVRLERLLATAGAEDIDARLAAVTRGVLQRLTGVTDARMPADTRALQPLVPPGQRDAIRTCWPTLRGLLREQDVPAAIAWASRQKLDARAAKRDKEAARTELATRLEGVPAVAEGAIAALEAERSRLEREVGAAQEQRRATEQASEKIHKLDQELTDARRALVEVERAQPEIGELERWRGRVVEIDAALAALTPPAPPDESGWRALEDQARGAEAFAAGLVVPTVPSTAAQSAAVAEAERRLAEAERLLSEMTVSPLRRANEIVMEIRGLAKGKTPAATRIREATYEIRQLLDDASPEVPDTEAAEQAMTEAQEALDNAQARVSTVAAERTSVLAERTACLAQATELRAEAERQREPLRASYATACAAHGQERQRRIRERASLVTGIEHGREAGARQAAALTAARATLARRQAERDALGPESDPPAPVDEAPLLRVQEELAELTLAQASRTELATLVAALATLGDAAEVYAAIEYALQAARAAAITAVAGGPLLDRMVTFLAAAGRSERPYIRAAKGACEIGWTRGEVEVAVEALSGGQFVVFAAALTAAVLIVRAAPVRLLLVEAGETDTATFAALCCGIGAVAWELTAAVVLYCHDAAPPGWTIVRLDGNGA